jgi:hypothetical protein
MNEWLHDAALRPVPKKLCGEVWFEGELTIFFGSTGEGKTAFALQVGNDIASGRSSTGLELESSSQLVLYVDFELSDTQLVRRYAVEHRNGDGSGNYVDVYRFDDNLMRIEVNAASRVFDQVTEWEKRLLKEMERAIVDSGAKIVIIDNITWLSRETDKGRFALPLMQRLCDLKKQHGLSVLVLAHTPKRDETQPITLNDLAGSRILANLADSVFAIGKSAADSGIRYLKQLKVRSAEMLYGMDNVAVFEFGKDNNFLGFMFIGESSEREHLGTLAPDARDELIAKARALRVEGKTRREICRGARYFSWRSKQICSRRSACEHREQGEQREH